MYFKSQRNMIKLVASGKGTRRMENEWEGDFALYTHLHLLNLESCKFTFHIIQIHIYTYIYLFIFSLINLAPTFYLFIYLFIYLFLVFVCHVQLVGSQFPDQVSNLCPLHWEKGVLMENQNEVCEETREMKWFSRRQEEVFLEKPCRRVEHPCEVCGHEF